MLYTYHRLESSSPQSHKYLFFSSLSIRPTTARGDHLTNKLPTNALCQLISIMIKFLTYIVAISAFIIRVASKQEVFSRVVVGISEETLYNIQFNIPSAIANRVLQFMHGFDTVHRNLATLANIENPQEILLLSKNHSHIIIFDWFDKFIYRVCNRTVYNPIRLFRHVSMHTIEGPKKFATGLRLSEEDLRQFKGSGCERNDDDSVSLRAFFVNIDALLLGLRFL